MKTNNRKELQNIAINYSTDIDYKNFIKIILQILITKILLKFIENVKMNVLVFLP